MTTFQVVMLIAAIVAGVAGVVAATQRALVLCLIAAGVSLMAIAWVIGT